MRRGEDRREETRAKREGGRGQRGEGREKTEDRRYDKIR